MQYAMHSKAFYKKLYYVPYILLIICIWGINFNYITCHQKKIVIKKCEPLIFIVLAYSMSKFSCN